MTSGRIAALALTGVLVMTAATGAVTPRAEAAAPTYERGDSTSWECVINEDPLVEMQGVLDRLSESRVEIFVQLEDGFLAPDSERTADLAITPDSVSGTIPMLRYVPGEAPVPADPASVDLTLTSLGEPERSQDSPRTNENARSRTVAFTQPVSVSGSVTVDGVTYSDISNCLGSHDVFTTRTTNPDTVVGGIGAGGTYDASCVLGDLEGVLQLTRDGKDSIGFFETFSEENPLSGVIDQAVWHPGELRGTYTVDESGIATAHAVVTQGAFVDEFDLQDTLGPFRRTFHLERYDASGQLVLSDGTAWDLTCTLEISKGMSILHSPSGPNLTNDAPADAIPLLAGQLVELKTGRAQRAGEIGTQCAESEFTHTVWYSVVGAGQEITLDTAGSDFDTVVAVYVERDGHFDEVACGNNDDDDRFATVTWTADTGVRYLVEVGGADGQSGNLVLTRSG